MSNNKPRAKISPADAKVGDIIEVKTLISHVMETGLRKDKNGQTIARNIINKFTATFEGEPVFSGDLQPGISANPYIAFNMRLTKPGAFELTWVDDAGESYSTTVPVTVG